MSAEFTVKQSDTAQFIQQTVDFDAATNLVGATAQFVYRTPDGTVNVMRSATIVSASPSSVAATSAVLNRTLTLTDVATAGVFVFEWKITLSDLTVIQRPKTAATADYADRAHQTFEVVESLSVSTEDSTEDAAAFITRSSIVVANLTELRALPFSSNYFYAKVYSDANGMPGDYWWDASIVTADDDGNLTIALDSGTGGWRRKGL